MITTAEGAETPEEIHALRNIGCTQVQGFAYGKPMSYEAASALVASMESGTGHAIPKPRETRVSMFSAAPLIEDDLEYPAVIRKLSAGGAVEGAEDPLTLGKEVWSDIPP